MCTVVVRWSASAPVELLALRDELVGRAFDDPGQWWDGLPAVGGRDRVAGGTWCATDVPAGRTALVLNRPERRTALPGAPSRGVLPLRALADPEGWAAAPDLTGTASWTVVVAEPDRLVRWDFDGTSVTREDLEPGTHVVASGGAERGKADRHLAAFTALAPDEWTGRLAPPQDDPAALVVRHEAPEGRVFATVLGQRLTTEPGALLLSWSRTPWQPTTWTARRWP